jgi:C-terminal processing protease CtpA/Prc
MCVNILHVINFSAREILTYFVIFMEKVGSKAKQSSNEVKKDVDSKGAREFVDKMIAKEFEPDYSDDSEDDKEFEKEIETELQDLQKTGSRLKYFLKNI